MENKLNQNIEQEKLTSEEYARYGRQMILPEIGLPGQLALKNSSALIIGVGGLGCPAAQYITAAGIGTIGLLDGDVVDKNNLHRQVIHSTSKEGMPKAESAKQFLQDLNPHAKIHTYVEYASPQNLFEIISAYDIVLDCTDNQFTRYLISDVCVWHGKPLISASALQFEGQLCIYNYCNGPCYRCMFPNPTPVVTSCAKSGILGPVVGTMGTMQALETIKLALSMKEVNKEAFVPFILLFHAFKFPQWKHVRIRSRQQSCKSCGPHKVLTRSFIESSPSEYVTLCDAVPKKGEKSLNPIKRITPKELSHLISESSSMTFLDVREPVQYGICNLPSFKNVPLSEVDALNDLSGRVCVICRSGNTSQAAVRKLQELNPDADIFDVMSGLQGWSKDVDPLFPLY
ncbi:thiosulfate sulfurtransferase, URM1 activating enzyme E1-type Uba42 [Schizosaccharomyces osmophilus]|uniref:Thiosulfate sulfurtransferase, URM1 activating enzyme E1-type Uba42 n=1 Tax=Schizosaccharomyces osmophilus TaxID=2545709 RepID=A0AAE9W8Z4_9SCHI|nr:thiosulfate sulfurtransferase, URM1 activating enzyme E1-type Uba42 [Schizosaccharomyces osmophilus]WBW71947.1 thiosulfate sulfurtransferase, URM1 activating enzyme E1-type Uba42 [Schizosaccharomyces osmophilus]